MKNEDMEKRFGNSLSAYSNLLSRKGKSVYVLGGKFTQERLFPFGFFFAEPLPFLLLPFFLRLPFPLLLFRLLLPSLEEDSVSSSEEEIGNDMKEGMLDGGWLESPELGPSPES